jgi:hypothetical protein
MSVATENAGAFFPRTGERARSIEYLNVSAVTGWFDGGEKRTPDRIRNVYVRSSRETVGRLAAISGTSCQPAGAAECW